jgi:hypothetical protein
MLFGIHYKKIVKKFINRPPFFDCMRTSTILIITHIPYMIVAVAILLFMIRLRKKLSEISGFLERKNAR